MPAVSFSDKARPADDKALLHQPLLIRRRVGVAPVHLRSSHIQPVLLGACPGIGAYGRHQIPEDACSREALHAAFAAAKGNVLELLVAVTQTDGFLYRPLNEVAP